MNCQSSYQIYVFYKSNSIPIWSFGEEPFIPASQGKLVKYLRGNYKDSYTTRKQLIYGQCTNAAVPNFTCGGDRVGTRTDTRRVNGSAKWSWDYKIDSCGNLYADYIADSVGIEVKSTTPTPTVGCFASSNLPCCKDENDECICSYSNSLIYTKKLWEDSQQLFLGDCGAGYTPVGGGLTIINENTAKREVYSNFSDSESSYSFHYTEISEGQGTTVLSVRKDLSFFQEITYRAVSNSIDNKDSLNNPCISYSPWNLTQTSWNSGDKGIAINALKILLAVKKDDFKRYPSISGKYYIYYGGQPNETPCCQECGGPECFTGTIVKSTTFSFPQESSTELELPDYFIGSFLKIDNYSDSLPLNQSLKLCYTIDNKR